MAVIFVDDAIFDYRRSKWCHVFSMELDALHDFADLIGLKRKWFQEPPKASWPHYDTIAWRRQEALQLGAVAADKYTTLAVAKHLQGSLTQEWRRKLAILRAKFNYPKPEGSPA